MLTEKNILLGVTGGIAAYKAAYLTRLFIKAGAHVKIVMTPAAKQFITPITLATLSKNPILVDFYNPENGDWNSHVEMGIWADAMVIAPATANTIGKMANGIADNLLVTSYLSARCPVFVAPAMDLDMYAHPSTKKNLETLKGCGNHIIEAGTGELASGLSGKGRMADPEDILQAVANFFTVQCDLSGKSVLITTGPTYEKIDPVRFIGNYSSGKMGFAIAEEAAKRGADVTLITGPTHLQTCNKNITRIDVESAQQMFEACKSNFDRCHAAILSAAVADYRPAKQALQKIKKENQSLAIELEPTVDIAAYLGSIKKPDQVLVGFALETEHGAENAQLKLRKKNFDFIVLNQMTDPDAGFNVDTNKVTFIFTDNPAKAFNTKSKSLVAADIINELKNYLH
jgi:phosphopantothenoylcysteine decarboxylase / phosphopantothenate---cysteine ligase